MYVTRHEKTGFMYAKYTFSYNSLYLLYYITYLKSVCCMRFLMKCYIIVENCIRIGSLYKKLFHFKIQKCGGKILCAHD